MDYLILSLVALCFAARDLINEGAFILHGSWWQKKNSDDFPLWQQLLWPFRDGWHATNWLGLALLIVAWPLVATVDLQHVANYALLYMAVFETSHGTFLRRE